MCLSFIRDHVSFNRKPAPRFFICLALVASLVAFMLPVAIHQPLTAHAAPLSVPVITCRDFTQVNDDAFGMGTGPSGTYSSEEGFEVTTFNGKLYLGMEADNTFGARIWRTKSGVAIPHSQADWEEVAAVDGLPFGVANITQNDHIDSLAEFNGYIFASTANGGSNILGTRVFRSPTGDAGTWEDAIAAYGAGFGMIENTNFKDMQVFQGYLCGGTQNLTTGAQVWCTANGTTWTQKNYSGFGLNSPDQTNLEVWSGHVYNGGLYFGVQNQGLLRINLDDDTGKVFRTFDLNGTPTWTEVFSGPAGSKRVDILGDLDGYIYISHRSSSGVAIYRSPSGNPGTWVQVNINGMDGSVANENLVVDSATVYNGALYMGVSNTTQGFELWRTTGALLGTGSLVAWEQVDGNGLGDPNNIHSQLAVFNGYLYSWTSNYISGQQVLQTECGLEETLPVSQTGIDYYFDPAIGATLHFSALGNATQATVRAYPGAWDSDGLVINGVVPVKRHYTVSIDGDNYLVDVELRYDQYEFDASNITSEETTYQAIWSGEDWQACPNSAQTSDPETNTVTCSNVQDLTKVVISGGSQPNAITLQDFHATAHSNPPLANWSSVIILVTGFLEFFRRRLKAV